MKINKTLNLFKSFVFFSLSGQKFDVEMIQQKYIAITPNLLVFHLFYPNLLHLPCILWSRCYWRHSQKLNKIAFSNFPLECFDYYVSKLKKQSQSEWYTNTGWIPLPTAVVSELNEHAIVYSSGHFALKAVFYFHCIVQCFAWFAFLSQFNAQNWSLVHATILYVLINRKEYMYRTL